MPNCRTLVLISGSGSNLQAFIDGIALGQLPLSLVGVISNRPHVQGLERAQKANISNQVLDHQTFATREAYDASLLELIESYHPELIILAGYMRIMSPILIQALEGKMLNIHPSLLPKYPGLHTHKRALENRDQFHGSSVHFVTQTLDGGPVIAQSKLEISSEDTEQSLIERVKLLEHQLYPKVATWFAEKRLRFLNNQAYLDDQCLIQPIQIYPTEQP